jgi:hypothetical protein
VLWRSRVAHADPRFPVGRIPTLALDWHCECLQIVINEMLRMSHRPESPEWVFLPALFDHRRTGPTCVTCWPTGCPRRACTTQPPCATSALATWTRWSHTGHTTRRRQQGQQQPQQLAPASTGWRSCRYVGLGCCSWHAVALCTSWSCLCSGFCNLPRSPCYMNSGAEEHRHLPAIACTVFPC